MDHVNLIVRSSLCQMCLTICVSYLTSHWFHLLVYLGDNVINLKMGKVVRGANSIFFSKFYDLIIYSNLLFVFDHSQIALQYYFCLSEFKHEHTLSSTYPKFWRKKIQVMAMLNKWECSTGRELKDLITGKL